MPPRFDLMLLLRDRDFCRRSLLLARAPELALDFLAFDLGRLSGSLHFFDVRETLDAYVGVEELVGSPS